MVCHPAGENAEALHQTAVLCVRLSVLSVTAGSSAEWLLRVWIRFMTIHHSRQVHTVIYFEQQGRMLMMHGGKRYTARRLMGVRIDNQFSSF